MLIKDPRGVFLMILFHAQTVMLIYMIYVFSLISGFENECCSWSIWKKRAVCE